ncbi:MAG: hypothetical protein C0483_11470 [Pirellula sp.]|nr:hypothetical protein [Pirellula sp.]
MNHIRDGHGLIPTDVVGWRYVKQQVNQAYTMVLSSQFQGFCRDLHSECTDIFVNSVTPASVRIGLRVELLKGRKLETGNPNPGNIGNDFNRLGLTLWDSMVALDAGTTARKATLELMNVWRNAIGHQDFDKQELNNRTTLSLPTVNSFRLACEGLATTMDNVMRAHLQALFAVAPW